MRKEYTVIVKNLRSLADSIEGLVEVVDTKKPELVEVPEKIKEAGTEKKEKQPTLEEVRAVLAALVQSGKRVEVKSLVSSFEADKLSDIPADAYCEVLKKANKL